MIEPDFNLLLWLILIMNFFSAIAHIICGAVHKEKDRYYDGGDVILGLIMLIVLFYIMWR